MEGQLVQLVCGNPQQCSHLVDECARTACTGAVHTLFNAACQEYYLSVLAAKLYNSVSVGLLLLNGKKSRVDLLNEWDIRRICQSQTCRARDTYGELLVGIVRLNDLQLVSHRLLYLGEMALILGIQDISVAVGYDSLYRGRSHVNAERILICHYTPQKKLLSGGRSAHIVQFAILLL